MLTSAKLRGPRHYKVYFLKLHMGVYLRAKFEVSSITLIGLRQGEGVILPPPPPQNEPLKSPPRLELNCIELQKYLRKKVLNNNVSSIY